MAKKLAGPKRGGGRGRGGGQSSNAAASNPGTSIGKPKGAKGRGRGPGGKATVNAEAKKKVIKAKAKVKAMAKAKAKGKSQKAGKALAAGALERRVERVEVMRTPVRGSSSREASTVSSPQPPGSDGKFLMSARRLAQKKRLELAKKNLSMLRAVCLPGLDLPPHPFARQSFTVAPDPANAAAHSPIGVILKSSEFYVPKVTMVPRCLVQFAHADAKGGSSIGFNVYPSLLIAPLVHECR